ncbi:ribosome assembly RNA-binding protein YhbY [Selenihalanaerobacter shriftii]|uniref:RNA-binding protein n=1 Tax=Selenihalanaerobacter shriftii TaxID=142842 RepID=A0A1T4PQ84_9FIRM|nr:ribosome assembly RNA-binding protein YhbY [Selenihalanaerobacter shriftii]SJZ93038.1 RNA-binding protein [Selenihalanaerobacter shriftii]
MLTGKQRSYLRGKGNQMNPIVQIGKDGINSNLVEQTDDALEARELIKVRALNNSLYTAREAADELAEECGAEVVQVIGNVFLIYRRNDEDPIYNLPN